MEDSAKILSQWNSVANRCRIWITKCWFMLRWLKNEKKCLVKSEFECCKIKIPFWLMESFFIYHSVQFQAIIKLELKSCLKKCIHITQSETLSKRTFFKDDSCKTKVFSVLWEVLKQTFLYELYLLVVFILVRKNDTKRVGKIISTK